jgi:iron complex transport system ATP-binding protein
MIEAKNITVNRGGKTILHGLSARIKKGKITAILGPNGAGKSTLLQCLTGAIRPTHGTITLDGTALQNYSLQELAQKRAVLSQSTSINFPFTALEIVMMGRNPHSTRHNTHHSTHHGAKRDHAIARQALDALDAADLQARSFPTLSGGEQQRVQLARVLAQLWEQEHGYLFLDEPTSALDLKHQHGLLRLLSHLATTRHFAICTIVHDLNLAMHYADEVILLKENTLFAAGPCKEALTPDNLEQLFEIPASLIFPSAGASPSRHAQNHPENAYTIVR